MKAIFTFLLLLNMSCLLSQDNNEYSRQIDSLKKIVNNARHDSVINNALIKWDYIVYIYDPQQDSILLKKIETICLKNLNKNLNTKERLTFTKQYCISLIGQGMFHHNKGDFNTALKLYNKVLKINTEIKDENKQAACYNNIGNIYMDQGKYTLSLKYHLKALKLREANKNESEIATSYNNIGLIYENQGNHDLALVNTLKALKIQEKIHDESGAAYSCINLGVLYKGLEEYEKALQYYQKSLNINTKIGDRLSMSACYGNMGTIYESQAIKLQAKGDFKSAQEKFNQAKNYYRSSLEISNEFNEKSGIVIANLNLGILCMHQKEYITARNHFQKSLAISKEIGYNKILNDSYKFLSQLDSINGDYKGAYYNFYNYILYRDSIFNEENTKKLVEQRLQYDFDKKTKIDSVAFAKQNEINEIAIAKQDLELRTRRNQQFILFIGIGFVLIFAGFMYNRFRVTQKQKRIIELQKNDVENKKELIEEKNKEITDSINYAKRLQDAILPPKKMIDKYLKDNFILFKPKDIVAGDFYWAEKVGNYFFLAAADCTGHGVPGAMVSVVCSNALNRTVKEFGITETGKILDKTTELVLETFEKSDEDVKDGMDISLLAVAFRADAESESERIIESITWSGANNPLWYIENGEMQELKADKQPIGKSDNRRPFTTHSLPLSLSSLFLFTDGYADQFGGVKGKKFKYKPFQDILLQNASQPMGIQKDKLDNVIESWKGDLEQNDDICIIGVRF